MERMGDGFSVAHAARLAAQLPLHSRCLSKVDPDLAWSEETTVLNACEYLLRCLVYQNSGCKGEKPRPNKTPGERKRLADRLTSAQPVMTEVAEILGL